MRMPAPVELVPGRIYNYACQRIEGGRFMLLSLDGHVLDLCLFEVKVFSEKWLNMFVEPHDEARIEAWKAYFSWVNVIRGEATVAFVASLTGDDKVLWEWTAESQKALGSLSASGPNQAVLNAVRAFTANATGHILALHARLEEHVTTAVEAEQRGLSDDRQERQGRRRVHGSLRRGQRLLPYLVCLS